MIITRLNNAARATPSWPIYLIAPLPILWLFWAALNGDLGVDPVKAIEHQLGLWSLQLLIVGLAITPLRSYFGLNLLKFRRAIGLVSFFYVLAHLLVWLVLDVQLLDQIWGDILKRPYITIGMSAFLLMIPLAVTSNNRSVRLMGPYWRKLHKATYAIILLGGIHYVMVAKGFQIVPLIYLTIIGMLLVLRVNFTQAWAKLSARFTRFLTNFSKQGLD